MYIASYTVYVDDYVHVSFPTGSTQLIISLVPCIITVAITVAITVVITVVIVIIWKTRKGNITTSFYSEEHAVAMHDTVVCTYIS